MEILYPGPLGYLQSFWKPSPESLLLIVYSCDSFPSLPSGLLPWRVYILLVQILDNDTEIVRLCCENLEPWPWGIATHAQILYSRVFHGKQSKGLPWCFATYHVFVWLPTHPCLASLFLNLLWKFFLTNRLSTYTHFEIYLRWTWATTAFFTHRCLCIKCNSWSVSKD